MARILAFIAGMALIQPVLAAPALPHMPLQWQFKEGDKFYIEEIVTSKSETIRDGNPGAAQEQTVIMVWQVKVAKVTEQGEVILEHRIESVDVDMQRADRLQPKLNEMKGLTFRTHFNRQMELTRFEGYAEFVKKMDEVGGARTVKNLFSEGSFKGRFAEPFQYLPNKGVEVGGTWKNQSETQLAAVAYGMTKVEREFTYEGAARVDGRDADMLVFIAKLTHKPADQPDAQPKFIGKSEVKGGKHTGTLLFDSRNGRLLGMETQIKDLETAVTLDRGGDKMEMGSKLNRTTRWKVLDQLPSGK